MFLVKTSFCFIICSAFSFYYYEYIFGLLFGLLFITSFIHHSYGACEDAYPVKTFGRIISSLDKSLARAITTKSLLRAGKIQLYSIIYITLVYYFKVKGHKLYLPNKIYFWHGSIHVISTLGYLSWFL